jgi:hypothetical protein
MWAQPKNQNYTMWMATDKVFPHNKPNIANHNLIVLKQFYLTQQQKYYSNIIEKKNSPTTIKRHKICTQAT